MSDLDRIIANFKSLDDVLDKYEYLSELGGELEPMSPSAHSEANRVPGCLAQVWLETYVGMGDPSDPTMIFRGDSNAKLVKGLVYIAICLYSGRKASEIELTDAKLLFAQLGLGNQVTAQRSNGFTQMLRRIHSDALRARAGTAGFETVASH